MHLRIDTIEDALLRSSLKPVSPEEAGYLAAYGVAADNLHLGRDVAADAVNAVEIARAGWRRVADEARVRMQAVEIVCSDARAHRARVEGRAPDFEALAQPDWAATSARPWEPWPETDLIRIDTAGRSVESCLVELTGRLAA